MTEILFPQPRPVFTAQQLFEQIFQSAPPEINVAAIRQEWQAIRPPYRIETRKLPLPVWARRKFTDDGPQAWAALRREADRIDPALPFCIYIHLPFCSRRCNFCDCYSFQLQRHRTHHITTYLACLAQEMQLWSRLGTLAHRPVSTIHLGGGTPTFLGAAGLRQLAKHCREMFNTNSQTEWALESTTAELTDEVFFTLDDLNFTRLHLGIQSLEDPVRRVINRRESTAAVLEKIAKAISMGWVVSVDLIYGLPGQTLTGLLNDIKTLADIGVDGFSLYELQLSPRNRKFAEQCGLTRQNRLVEYFFLQAASRLLATLGYRKTLFNHFARAQDTNLYFTFPERGEDCLALGTIADGVFGDYHYRHPEYAPYCRLVNEDFPALQGGLQQTNLETRIQPLEVALLSGCISPSLFAQTLNPAQFEPLRRRWQESALVEDTLSGRLRLTTNGSWFVGEMMTQLFA